MGDIVVSRERGRMKVAAAATDADDDGLDGIIFISLLATEWTNVPAAMFYEADFRE